MRHAINLDRQPEKFLEDLSAGISQRIINKLEGAFENSLYPKGSIKIKGQENIYRMRVGNYRILYRVIKNELRIFVFKIEHRNNVYKSL